MKKLAEKYDYEKPEKIHLPALLRCIIMIQHGLLDGDDEAGHDHIVLDLCNTFERGAETLFEQSLHPY